MFASEELYSSFRGLVMIIRWIQMCATCLNLSSLACHRLICPFYSMVLMKICTLSNIAALWICNFVSFFRTIWIGFHFLVQHSIDYWLWADLIAPESQRVLKNVIRVERQEEADIFYVPFFTTISYFLLEKQECKALYRVWKHFSRFTF